MTIQEAKEQIRRCVQIYLQKDRYGHYRIPVERQRPVFLLGAPGIGKTAVMEQLSQELGLPLLSYSMTHHTRQSALGLPIISDKTYQGKSFSVSEYTLSEIIASIYECMEKSGCLEGILFLDEINCVSETLAPSMLQFLQYKTFGNHRIPEGWVIVTAGNPPQYNRAVREFDLVTLDRLKVMEIEPDFDAWQRYAREAGVHRSIQTFLDIRRDFFYRIETGGQERAYVTARGWEDLSDAIFLYEENGYPVDEALVSQYIRHQRIADEFTTYYALYKKYRGEYQIREILDRTAGEPMLLRARAAALDERITVLELLLEALVPQISSFMAKEAGLKQVQKILRPLKDCRDQLSERLSEEIETLRDRIRVKDEAGLLPPSEKEASYYALSLLREQKKNQGLLSAESGENAFHLLRAAYMEAVRQHEEEQNVISQRLESLFGFVESCWGTGSEMLILVTELSSNPGCISYLYSYGCSAYDKNSDLVRLSERKKGLDQEIRDYQRGEA